MWNSKLKDKTMLEQLKTSFMTIIIIVDYNLKKYKTLIFLVDTYSVIINATIITH